MNEGFRALPEEVQKKILGKAGGGVMQRPLFRQMGGPAEPMPQDMSQDVQEEGEMLGQEIAARTQESIDAATDVEGAINALRGNDMPLDARYQELAGLVGERDAMQTPESVLALTQPAIMMTQQGAMDSGIGELMQAVAGDTQMDQGMDQGLGALMMQGAGSTPPENFRRGGPVMVRKFQDGTPPTGNSSVPAIAKQNLGEYQALFSDLLGSQEERAAELERDRQRARSDAMFNLANFGLALAGETQGGSVAERLANAAARSNVVGGFQQAGKDVAAAQKASRAADQQMSTAALQAALTDATRQAEQQDAMALAAAKQTTPDPKFSTKEVKFSENGKNYVKIVVTDERTGRMTESEKMLAPGPNDSYSSQPIETADGIKIVVTNSATGESFVRRTFEAPEPDPNFTTQIIDTDVGKKVISTNTNTGDVEEKLTYKSPPRSAFTFETVETKDGVVLQALNKETGEITKTKTYEPPEEDVKGIPASVYNSLTPEQQLAAIGVVPVVADKYTTEFRETADGLKLFVINERTGDYEIAETFDPVAEEGGLVKFTIENADGTITETVEMLGSEAGQKLQAQVNNLNKPGVEGSGSMIKVGTETINPQAYLTEDGQVITSFDNKTFTSIDGKVQLLKDVGAKALGNSDVYEIIKSKKIADYAAKRVQQRMDALGPINFVDENGDALDATTQSELRDFLRETSTALLSVSEDDVRKGTGLVSNVFAAFNAVGGTLAPETFNSIFGKNAKARKNLGLFNLVAVSAMARNPRLAVYDMQQVKDVLINPKNLLANTATEAANFQSTVALMVQERNAIEDALRLGDPKVMDDVGGALAKLKEIDFVLSLVRLSPNQQSSMSLDDALGQTEEEFE